MVDSADSALVRNAQLAGDAADPAAAFLDTVLDALADGVLACSRSGVPIVVNRSARQLYESVTGAPWDDHTGRAWLDQVLSTAVEHESVRRGVTLGLHELAGVEVTVAGADREHTMQLTSHPVARPG